MSPASSSFPSSASRPKWKKRKRGSNLDSSTKKQNPPRHQQEDDDDGEEEEEATSGAAAAEEEDEDQDLSAAAAANNNPNADPVVDLRQGEVLSDGGQRISNFPAVVRHSVNRPHPSVLAIVSAERSVAAGDGRSRSPVFLENISHGQLQLLSAVLPDNPSLNPLQDPDKPPAYVCTTPALMEGKGVVKRFGNEHLLVVPVHSEWFNPNTVHRLERQVVSHFFSGKSCELTPERYMQLRNRIVAKYLENPERRLSYADCQGLVSRGELYDLSRIIRFLDSWGIINYLAVPGHRGPRVGSSLLWGEADGRLHVQALPLRSIDSLVQFDGPRCSYRPEEVSALSSSSVSVGSSVEIPDLDRKIRERLSEYACNYCSQPLSHLHYRSRKEADIILCSDCFNDAKFITGHSSVDFVRAESMKDMHDLDSNSWTDRETFLLLEALEIYNDNWNGIAEHVGTKSKAQCILHFIRLPMEDGLLENIELPCVAVSSDITNGNHHGMFNLNSNGVCLPDSSSTDRLPFITSENPVMALVAFLASALGPRVAATCASASLSVLTKEDMRIDWMRSGSTCSEGGCHGEHTNLDHQIETLETQGVHGKRVEASAPFPPEKVKAAAMFGLSAAAMKAKLFADQEEREIQRMVAATVTQQLKRLELKLKQFTEVETLLMKECEQVERSRQRLSAERVRVISVAAAGTSMIPAAAAVVATANSSIRPQVILPSVGQANISSAYGNNLQSNPHMPFMPHPPMFPFGPHLPLSAIHPSSTPSTNVFSSGTTNASNPNHHPLLRPLSGDNTNIG